MAYYVPTAAASLTATNANDTITILGRGTTLTAQSVMALTAATSSALVLSAKPQLHPQLSRWFGWGGSGAAKPVTSVALLTLLELPSPANSQHCTVLLASLHLTGVVTSQATRTANSIYLQGNAGNDTIALGDSLFLLRLPLLLVVKATTTFLVPPTLITFGLAQLLLDGTVINAGAIEGGNGNDTIVLQGAAYFSAVSLNANKGDDVVDIRSAQLNSTLIGLGAGNDNYSGVATGANASTIAGGKGNDIISLTFTEQDTLSGNIIAGDRGNNVVLDGDGNDSIYINITASTTLASGTVYGGGGNDSIQLQGTGTTNALFVSMKLVLTSSQRHLPTRLRAPSSAWVLVMTLSTSPNLLM